MKIETNSSDIIVNLFYKNNKLYVHLKVKTKYSLSVQSYFIFFKINEKCIEIWKVYFHVLRTMYMECLIGETGKMKVMVHGNHSMHQQCKSYLNTDSELNVIIV